MATKEDILEQIVEEYLLHKGYFVCHNVKYLPRVDHPDFVSNQDSNHSDIDVIGFNPKLNGKEQVMVVSCKSWQSGFDPAKELKYISNNKRVRGKEAWKTYRELIVPKWSEAFMNAIVEKTGKTEFTYMLAVTKLNGDKSTWESCKQFSDSLGGNPIKILELREILNEIYPKLSTTLSSTEVGRMLQIFKASGLDFKFR